MDIETPDLPTLDNLAAAIASVELIEALSLICKAAEKGVRKNALDRLEREIAEG